jgi:hypothetical protein
MSVHEASEFGRTMRAQQCRCGEFPQANVHTGRGALWFCCTPCGKVSQESQDPGRAVDIWNELNKGGETC